MRYLHALNLGLIPLLALSLITAGCGKVTPAASDATALTMPNQNGVARAKLPAGVFATRITLTPNTATIPVGEQRQFSISVLGTNGQTYTDPRLVSWSLSDPQAGMINDQGVLTPQVQRQVQVRASLDNQVGLATITITPANYTWQQVQSPTAADLYAVKMLTSTEAYAGGAQGVVMRLYNGTWQLQNFPVPQSTTWRGVDFCNGGNGWMVGHQGPNPKESPKAFAMAFRNGSWFSPEQTPINVAGALLAVDDVAANNAWAVGRDQAGKTLIMHWNGSTWTRDTSYNGKGQLNAIQMLGGSDGWAVGTDGSDALVLHFDGLKWTEMPLHPLFGTFSGSELYGIYMLNNQQGLAVGKKKDMLGVTRGLMLSFDGRGNYMTDFTKWSEKKAASGATRFLDQVPLRGISMIDSNRGWLLGEVVTPNRLEVPSTWFGGTIPDLFGNLLGFDGTSYDVDNNFRSFSLADQFNGIHVLPEGHGAIVGTHGYVMQRGYDWRNASTAPQSGQLGGTPITQIGTGSI